MRMERKAKATLLLLGLVAMLGFTKSAMADCSRPYNGSSKSFLGLTVNVRAARTPYYYYNPYERSYSYYPDYYSYQAALRKIEREKRELAMKERFISEQLRAERYTPCSYPDRRYADYYRY